jgi:hypothetical protein
MFAPFMAHRKWVSLDWTGSTGFVDKLSAAP